MAAKTRKQQIEEMLAEAPDDPELRYALAMEYAGSGDHTNAARIFQNLATSVPDYVPCYYHLAQTLVRLGQTDEARSVIESGIKVAQKKGDFHAAGELEGLLYTLE